MLGGLGGASSLGQLDGVPAQRALFPSGGKKFKKCMPVGMEQTRRAFQHIAFFLFFCSWFRGLPACASGTGRNVVFLRKRGPQKGPQKSPRFFCRAFYFQLLRRRVYQAAKAGGPLRGDSLTFSLDCFASQHTRPNKLSIKQHVFFVSKIELFYLYLPVTRFSLIQRGGGLVCSGTRISGQDFCNAKHIAFFPPFFLLVSHPKFVAKVKGAAIHSAASPPRQGSEILLFFPLSLC